MTDTGRIVLLYRRAQCSPHAERLLRALDERYAERDVMDLGLNEDAVDLRQVANRLRADDVVLALIDSEWETSDLEEEGSVDDDVTLFGRNCVLSVAVDGAAADARLALCEETWEADVQRALRELDLLLVEPSDSCDRARIRGGEIDELFAEAAELQKSGRHQDAIDLFQTIAQSKAPGLAGPAAYAAGRSYEKLRDSNHAVRAYHDAMSLGPRDAAAAAAYGLGRLLARRREFDQAVAAFSEAIELGDASMRARAEDLRDDAIRKAVER